MQLELLLPALRANGGKIRRASWPKETHIYSFHGFPKPTIFMANVPSVFGDIAVLGTCERYYFLDSGIWADDWEEYNV